MTKKELQDLVLLHAKHGSETMIERHGSWPQTALILDHKGAMNMIVIADKPLHGAKMANMLRIFAASFGGANAILVQADARMKAFTPEELKRRKYSENDIADDPANQECFITVGRSREHSVVVTMPYSRTPGKDGDVIVFKEPDPKIDDGDGEIFMIPDIWEKVN